MPGFFKKKKKFKCPNHIKYQIVTRVVFLFIKLTEKANLFLQNPLNFLELRQIIVAPNNETAALCSDQRMFADLLALQHKLLYF